MIGAGDLDRNLSIQRVMQTGTDPFGNPITELAELTRLWAQRTDISDAEIFAAGGVLSIRRSRLVVRSCEASRGILPTDVLVLDGQGWNIEGIKETPDGRNQFLEITAARSN